MIKIRKFLTIFMGLGLTLQIFAFKINDLEFGKEIKKDQRDSKIFTLVNNEPESKIYKLEIEGDSDVEVFPELLNLASEQERDFTINVMPTKKLGNYSYFLVIREIQKERNFTGVDINKIIKIKQKYIIK